MKKNSIIIALLFAGLFTAFSSKTNAAVTAGGKEKVVIQTSAVCGECQEKIEGAVKKLDGVKSADLNLDNKKLTVTYDPAKVKLDEIKKAVSDVGYDADDVKANPTAYEHLSGCCKKGGHE